jgi:predicted transcriptional regulator
MAKTKQTIAGRVDPWIRTWIKREAERRDRTMSYIFEELLEESIQRRQDENSAAKAAA